MIRIKKNKEGEPYFKLWMIYWYGWFTFEIIEQEFPSTNYTLSDVKKIQSTIKTEMDRRFK